MTGFVTQKATKAQSVDIRPSSYGYIRIDSNNAVIVIYRQKESGQKGTFHSCGFIIADAFSVLYLISDLEA